ncbi:hypothetical protein BJ912DRAFT_1149848, partial [Pholiota molesta]
MNSPHPPVELDPACITAATENLAFRKWSAVAALAVLVWEYALTARSEFRYIWRRPVSVVKVIYLFARYYGLVVQAVNLHLVSGPLWNLAIPEQVCHKWFLFLIGSSCLLLAAVDAILMLRVYALYLQDVKAGIFLATLFIAQQGFESYIAPATVFGVPYDSICDSRGTHHGAVYFGVSLWVVHLTLVAMTLAKRNLAVLGAPVVRLVRRDGIWIVAVICGLFTAIIPYAVAKQVSKAHIAFGWPISIFSLSCCRMIMNMLQLGVNPVEETEESR